jgi:hypothetical protein
MKKLSSLLLASALLIPLAGAGPAGAQTQSASGQVQMTVHSHSAGVLQFPFQRLPYNFTTGSTFAYSSRVCSGNAPFNDIGLNFTPNYPGVDDNASSAARVRHGVDGVITSWNGSQGTVSGRLRTQLCVFMNGAWTASPNILVSYFEGQIILRAPNDLHFFGGFQFSPTESTGTFRDIQGGGRMEARFTCLGLSSCAPLGEFQDFVASTGNPDLPAGQLQPGLTGVFYDPTVLPVTTQPTA